jgi:hypothetical protein
MKEAYGFLQVLLVVFKLAEIGAIANWSWFQVLIPMWLLLVVGLLTGLLLGQQRLSKTFK